MLYLSNDISYGTREWMDDEMRSKENKRKKQVGRSSKWMYREIVAEESQ